MKYAVVVVPCKHVFKFLYDEHAEVIKYIPSIPERNAYIFGGWFKEIECINQWDFDLDIGKRQQIMSR